MSLENIIKYATNTPANTNPAVMSSVISRSFEESSNKIKQDLYKSGGVGYTEPPVKLTHDGNNDGKDLVPAQMLGWGEDAYFAKVSDRVITKSELIGFTVCAAGQYTSYDKSELSFGKQFMGLLLVDYGKQTYLVSASEEDATAIGVSAGTYVISGAPQLWVTEIRLAETIHPIDPKYLPIKIVDFDELGLTEKILEQFNKGGGSVSLGSGDPADIEPFCKAFPLDGDYVAKLSIPDMGTMYVNPVYTLTNEDSFKAAHFDSYIMMGNTLTKFYVRAVKMQVIGRAEVFFDIEVGFYA